MIRLCCSFAESQVTCSPQPVAVAFIFLAVRASMLMEAFIDNQKLQFAMDVSFLACVSAVCERTLVTLIDVTSWLFAAGVPLLCSLDCVERLSTWIVRAGLCVGSHCGRCSVGSQFERRATSQGNANLKLDN